MPPPDEASIIIAAPHVGWVDGWIAHTCGSRKIVLTYNLFLPAYAAKHIS